MKKIKSEKLSGGTKLFLGVCIFYLGLYFLKPNIFSASLFNLFVMIQKILPILFIVIVVNVFVNLFFTKERTQKYFGKDSGLLVWFYAIVSGILVSGPPYVLYPMLGDLKKRGMKDALIAVFLYNRNVKIPFLPILVFYFGLKYTVLLSILIIVFSIFNGLLVQLLMKQKKNIKE